MIVDRAQVAAALPGYELGNQLGIGAFGLVMAGWHRSLHRDVAIKVVAATRERTAAGGFATEARILAGLDHPHVVRVYDYVETADLRLIVMEMLGGGTLTRRQVGMSQETACAVGLAVAAALSFVHDRGVLHRDIKPDNVLFDNFGLLKVVDFGIAKRVDRPAATASGVVGTPLFMAPEQIQGGRLGPATDLYALGVVLYLLLTGRAPIDPQLLDPSGQHFRSRRQLVPRAPVGVPEPMANVVMGALAENPADRPASVHRFALDLAGAAAAAFRPGWISRSGIVLRLDDEVREAASPPGQGAVRRTAPPIARSDDERDGGPLPVSNETPEPTAVPSPQQQPQPPQERDQPARRGRRSRRDGAGRRRRVLTTASAALILGAIALTGAVLAPDGTPAQPATNPASRPTAASQALLSVAQPIGDELTGHTGWVWWVTYSPNSRILASSSQDDTVRLWDVTDQGKPYQLGEPLPHGGVAAFSPDGTTLVVGGVDGILRLWDITNPATPQLVGQPPAGHDASVWMVAFSPDGETVASSSKDSTVRLWDVSDRSNPHAAAAPLTGHAEWVTSVAFSPDGRTLASSGQDMTVRLWDVSDPGAPESLGEPLTGHTGWVTTVDFSPDGRLLASASHDQTVRLWDVSDDPAVPQQRGEPLAGHTDAVWSLAFSPDGQTLASASGDRTIRLWDVTDPSAAHLRGSPVTGHAERVWSVTFSANGRTLASGSMDRTIRLWAVV